MPAIAGPEVTEYDSQFNGGTFELVYPAKNLDEARQFRDNLAQGNLDPFLGHALERVEIVQNRNPDGTFGTGFTGYYQFRRPGPGENS